MTKSKAMSSKNPAQSWILWGIPVLCIVGSLMHFVYEWSGNSIIVGIFAPTNESVWEHLKMTFWPTVIWWAAGYFILGKGGKIPATTWFFSCTIAVLACPIVIVSFYYTYTGALGIESLILDIFSLFLGVTAGQVLALHIYKHTKARRYFLYISIAVLILTAAAFTVFSFAPPHIPLFKDSLTGKYGI